MSKQNRRNFIKKSALGGLGLASAASMGMSAQSYNNIIGSNDRLHVAIAGLGRRLKVAALASMGVKGAI